MRRTWRTGTRDVDVATIEVSSSGDAAPPGAVGLAAVFAQWLIGAGLAPDAYVASQGAALGRTGRVHVARIGSDIWIGGETTICIDGRISV